MFPVSFDVFIEMALNCSVSRCVKPCKPKFLSNTLPRSVGWESESVN
jgi:hypothetical protein